VYKLIPCFRFEALISSESFPESFHRGQPPNEWLKVDDRDEDDGEDYFIERDLPRAFVKINVELWQESKKLICTSNTSVSIQVGSRFR